MIRFCACLSAMIAICVAMPALGDSPKSAEKQQKFVKLYNGKDLTGWKVKDGKIDSWKADGELLSCVKEGGGWLRSDRMYSDFRLKLEYRIPAGGNSGVGLRFPEKGDPAHVGMEVQVLDDTAPKYAKLHPAQYNGGIYFQSAAKKKAAHPPGEWNKYEITCRGPFITVILNGEKIQDVNVDEFVKGEGDHLALADRPQVGYVGFQCHGDRVDFRNIEIQELSRTIKGDLGDVIVLDIVEGKGEVVPVGARVKMHYTGRLTTGKKFDSSHDRGEPLNRPLGGLISGWRVGIPGMRVGGRRKLVIPPELAYGDDGAGDAVPSGATLVFDVELLEIIK